MEAMTKIFNRENNPMKILEDIKQEYSDIQKQTSQVQKIISSIATRENCLEKIFEMLSVIDNTQRINLCKLFEQKISHLRILTIHCIQCIFQWKQTIQLIKFRSSKVQYTYNGNTYTHKIKEDYAKIINSQFKDIYKFDQTKNDVFFLNYSYNGKKISNVSKNLVKRIRLCEIMLSDDGTNPQVQRTPLIDKAKSPLRDFRERSISSRSKTSSVIPWTKVQVEYSQFHDYIVNILSKGAYKDSFQTTFDLSKYEQYTIYRFSQKKQEVLLGVDKNATQRKIFILALKSLPQTIEQLLKSCCEYLWENDICQEIRIALQHNKQKQGYSIDSNLQKSIKAVGFRWASVNQAGQIRTTIFAIKRPLDTIPQKPSYRTQSYPVKIQHLITSTVQQTLQRQSSKCFISVLDLLYKISLCNPDLYATICEKISSSNYLNSLYKLKQISSKQTGPGYVLKFAFSFFIFVQSQDVPI